ncbi:uncharacterized protein Pyn_09128 [Prunus yedoensis var. nudiflora]|uniref:Uncharacterized protein n=1 Tax=Prunus yedoensis var. nudiflora TaxID=2094558 RepID=A0A314ZCW5_PRUYE|nr:uncharacterized protein Pyn_09128 [Prunus yedoensis var. nudiflora]
MEIEELSNCEALPLLSLNHVSLLCRSVWNSLRFYEESWALLSSNALLHSTSMEPAMEDYESRPINPKDNHISFQVRAALCTDVGLVKRRLQDMGMRYVTAVVEDDGSR